MDIVTSYRSVMFDAEPRLAWLRSGWRALRLYAQKAKQAIQDGDINAKADMISRADELLTTMCGILESEPDSRLGQSLMHIYDALRLALLKANLHNSCTPLEDFDLALQTLDREFLKLQESVGEVT